MYTYLAILSISQICKLTNEIYLAQGRIRCLPTDDTARCDDMPNTTLQMDHAFL